MYFGEGLSDRMRRKPVMQVQERLQVDLAFGLSITVPIAAIPVRIQGKSPSPSSVSISIQDSRDRKFFRARRGISPFVTQMSTTGFEIMHHTA
jgi:hypothetical protein